MEAEIVQLATQQPNNAVLLLEATSTAKTVLNAAEADAPATETAQAPARNAIPQPDNVFPIAPAAKAAARMEHAQPLVQPPDAIHLDNVLQA